MQKEFFMSEFIFYVFLFDDIIFYMYVQKW